MSEIFFLYAVHIDCIRRLARIELGRDGKLRSLSVTQPPVGVDALHIVSPHRKGGRGPLPHRSVVEMDVPVLTAYPAATDKIGRDAHEPAIGIVVRRTRLAAYIRREVIGIAQPASRTALNDGTQHVYHLIGADF